MAAGLLAGCAASWVMNQFAQARPIRRRRGKSGDWSEEGNRRTSQREARQGGEEEQDATVATAVAISRNLFEHELSPKEKQIAGPIVHYAYGSLVGAIYGGLAELIPGVAAGFGLPFGFVLWLLGDEIAVPALGLSKGPLEYPPEAHADALAVHFMYGFTTDLLRRVLRHVI
jgi:hypothetical protein